MNWKTIILILFALLIPICLASPLPYWIEELPNGSCNIWTKINISAGGTGYLVIHKEPGYVPDGAAVFELFDDFSDGDMNGWTILNGGGTGTAKVVLYDGKYMLELQPGSSDGYNRVAVAYQYSSNGKDEMTICFVTNTTVLDGLYFGFTDGTITSASNDVPSAGYIFSVGRYRNAYHRIDLASSGTATAIASVSGSLTNNNYYVATLSWRNETFAGYLDGEQILTGSNTQYSQFGYIQIGSALNPWYIDWVFVRKLADQDPVVQIVSNDSTSMVIKISNPNSYALTDFQIAIPATGFVSNTSESLYVTYLPVASIDYYKSLGGYTLTISGDLGNVTIYLGSTLLYSGNITPENPYQTTFSYDVSSYTLNIVYHDYYNVSLTYPINSITQGTYTLTLVPVGNYTNESYYPLIITVAGKSYWISNYSNIPINVSITAYENTPITITTLLGQVITVPAKNQKVPIYFTNSWSDIQASTTPGHIIEFKTQEGYTVGYGEQINIKVPTGLVLTPYIDGYPLQPITVSQDLNLFYNPSNYIPHVSIYQTMDGKVIVSIQSSQPHNFTIMFYNSTGVVKNITVFPGVWTYTNENYTKVAVYVDGREYASLNLYSPNILQDWSSLDFPTKVLLSMFLMMICAIIYLTSGITMVLAAGIAIPLLILLPIPTQLIGIISAFMLLSALFYLYKKRM